MNQPSLVQPQSNGGMTNIHTQVSITSVNLAISKKMGELIINWNHWIVALLELNNELQPIDLRCKFTEKTLDISLKSLKIMRSKLVAPWPNITIHRRKIIALLSHVTMLLPTLIPIQSTKMDQWPAIVNLEPIQNIPHSAVKMKCTKHFISDAVNCSTFDYNHEKQWNFLRTSIQEYKSLSKKKIVHLVKKILFKINHWRIFIRLFVAFYEFSQNFLTWNRKWWSVIFEQKIDELIATYLVNLN